MTGFLDYLQAECGLALNTRKAYNRDLRLFYRYLRTIPLRDVSQLVPSNILGFLQFAKSTGLAVSSVARTLAAVKMFCRYLVLQRVLNHDPAATVETPLKSNRLPTILDEAAARTMIGNPVNGEDNYALRDQAMMMLLYASGMRASEVAMLKVTDINFDVGVTRVLGKGGKERIVPVAQPALEAVTRYIRHERRPADDKKDSGVLFLSRSGLPLAREDVFRTVRKYFRRTGLRGNVTPHTFRHAFATVLLSRGADLRSVQEMLGHADISTTQVYTHVDASRLKSLHKRFHPRG